LGMLTLLVVTTQHHHQKNKTLCTNIAIKY